MRKLAIAPVLIILMLVMVAPTGAANIHMHFFESADAFLTAEQFQLFSYAALENDEVTIVAYGLEENVQPSISLFDTDGVTMTEDLNTDELQVAVVQAVMPANGLYTFLVSRISEDEGLIRVMLFQGTPLIDLSVLDEIDPFLPSVAYMLAGDEENPVEVRLVVTGAIEVEAPLEVAATEEPTDATATPSPTPDKSQAAPALPQIFASRGTEIEVPPLEERITPVTEVSWVNDNSDYFYTLNVRSFPDPVTTSQKLNAQFSRMRQVVNGATIQTDIGDPEETLDLTRDYCTGSIIPNATLLMGPGTDYRDALTTLSSEEETEIVAQNGNYFLIVDLESPTGGTWVLKSEFLIDDALLESCLNIPEVEPPLFTPENRRTTPQAPIGSN